MEPADYQLSTELTELLRLSYRQWADHFDHDHGWDSPEEKRRWVEMSQQALALLRREVADFAAFVGINEAMFDDQPTTVAVFVCAAIAVAWVMLAGWAGSRDLSLFLWLAAVFWACVVAVIVVAIVAAPSAADSVESGLQLALLPLLVLAAVPLDPLGQLIPLDDQLTGCLLVALGIPVRCLASWLLARARAR